MLSQDVVMEEKGNNMAQETIDKFGGLYTAADSYSTPGSPDMNDWDVDINDDLKKTKGYTMATITASSPLSAINISVAADAVITCSNELSASETVVFYNVGSPPFASILEGTAWNVLEASGSAFTVEGADTTSAVASTLVSVTHDLNLGWNVQSLVLSASTTASALTADMALQSVTATSLGIIDAGSDPSAVTYYPADSNFTVSNGDALLILADAAGDYTQSDTIELPYIYSLVTGWQAISMPTNFYTASGLGAEWTDTYVTRIYKMVNGAYQIWNNETDTGENFNIDNEDGILIKAAKDFSWTPGWNGSDVDITMKELKGFSIDGGVVL